MLLWIVITKLNLALDTGKLASFVLRHRMSTIQNCIPGLNVQEIELHRITTRKYSLSASY